MFCIDWKHFISMHARFELLNSRKKKKRKFIVYTITSTARSKSETSLVKMLIFRILYSWLDSHHPHILFFFVIFVIFFKFTKVIAKFSRSTALLEWAQFTSNANTPCNESMCSSLLKFLPHVYILILNKILWLDMNKTCFNITLAQSI